MSQSQGLGELLAALVVAFGGDEPTSFGLGELYEDLIAAVQGGTSVPDSRLFLDAIGQGPLSVPNDVLVTWQPEGGYPIGSDLALNADTTTIEVLTSGVYAWTFQLGVDTGIPGTGTTGFCLWFPQVNQLTGTSFGLLSGTLSQNIQAPGVPGGCSGDCTMTWTVHCDAGDTFNINVDLSAESTTNATQWNIEGVNNDGSGTNLYVVRLA